MPPKKAPSKLPSVNDLARETKADGCSLGNSTLKPIMDSYGIRNRSITPANASLSPDELDTHAKAQDTEQPTSDKEVVLDEIIVTGLPLKQKTSADVWRNSHAVESTMAEPTRLLRRSQRASSTSQKITTTSPVPPLDKGVTAKKQEFEIGILRDDDCKSDELSLSSTLKRRRLDHESSPRIASRKSRSKWNNPDDMLTDPKSPLVNAKLRELLCSPMAWDILTGKEKEQILSKFPNHSMILDPNTPQVRPNVSALLNNNNFRNDVAQYQEGLGKGCHDPDWIRSAQAAHSARVAGLYDDFVAADFEDKWNMPIPRRSQADSGANEGDSYGVNVSESTTVSEYATNNQPPALQSADMSGIYPTEMNVTDRNEEMGHPNDGIVMSTTKTPEAGR